MMNGNRMGFGFFNEENEKLESKMQGPNKRKETTIPQSKT